MEDDIEIKKKIGEYVIQVYKHLLGREPDKRGYNTYVEAIFNGRIDIRYLCHNIKQSKEYKLRKLNVSNVAPDFAYSYSDYFRDKKLGIQPIVQQPTKKIRRKSVVDLSKTIQTYHRNIKNILIGITTYQCLDDTKKTIESVKSQDIYAKVGVDNGYKIDILVVDNCSTDGSLEWFGENNIDHILLEGRKCVAAAWNKLIEKVYDYDCVIVLNNDVILEKDYISKLINDFTNYSNNCIFMNGVTKNNTITSTPDGLESFDDLIIPGDFSAFIVDRNTVEKVGYFDERYAPRLMEDNDYAHRVHLSGNKCIRNHKCRFEHVLGNIFKQNIGNNKDIPNIVKRNMTLYKDKWNSLPKGSKGFSNMSGIIGQFTGGDLGYEGIYDYIKGFDTAIIMILGRFGDTLTALPVAKWYHNRGKRVVWYTSELYSDFFKKISYIDEVVSIPKVLNSDGQINWVESFWYSAWNNAMKDIEMKDIKYIESKYGSSFGGCMRGFITPSINPLYAKEYDKCNIPFLQFMMILGGIDPYDKKNFNRDTLFPDLSDYVQSVDHNIKNRNVRKIGLALTGWSVPIPFKEGYVDSLCRILSGTGYELYNLSVDKINSKYVNNDIARPFIEMPKIVDDMDFIISIPTSIHEMSISLGIPSVFVISDVNGRINNKFSMKDQKIDQLINTVDYWYSQDKNPEELANIILSRIDDMKKE